MPKSPPTQSGLPMTIDPAMAIQHEIARQSHDDRMRAADVEATAEKRRRADVEVDSWVTTQSVPTPTPKPALTGTAEDGPGPINNAGQRVSVSFDPQNADEMWRYAQMLARSSLLSKAFYAKDDEERRHANLGNVHFVLMKGQALGLHPMVSIGNINVIDGKAEIGAALMVSLCLRSGLCEYFELRKSDERSATYATKRIGGRSEIEFTYTIEEADQMGLLDKGKNEWAKANNQWRKQPRTMLRRRAQSMLAREVYPDITMGLYDHDELAEMRTRELALGIDPDRVLASSQAPTALGESGPAMFEKLVAREVEAVAAGDPLKARLIARRATKIGPRRCSLCDSILDPRDSDPCIACSPPAAA